MPFREIVMNEAVAIRRSILVVENHINGISVRTRMP